MAKANKKSPKEASNTFHNIMKASVNTKSKTIMQGKIKATLKETYNPNEIFQTTVKYLVESTAKKYSITDDYEIRETLGKMNGWKPVGESLSDQIEITPEFFLD